MSQMSIRPSSQDVPAHPVTLTLADVRPGTTVRITEISVDVEPSTSRRLLHLGFGPGAEVEVLRRAPLTDPIIFRVAGCEFALRRAQARGIHVCVTA